MQAYVLTRPGTDRAYSLETRPDPVPGRGEVLIGMRAASINYRDYMMTQGTYGGRPRTGIVPLSDGAGEVLAVGEGVDEFKPGDRVSANFHVNWTAGGVEENQPRSDLGGTQDGMLAEQVVLPAHGLVKVPAHLSWEEAATLCCAGVTAWAALMEVGNPLRAGQSVLTLGTGGVSIFALQFAKAAGARVIATTSSEAKAQRLKAMGADHVVNYKANAEWQAEVKAASGGMGVDHVVEVGGSTLPKSLQSVRPGAQISLIGGLGGWDGQVALTAIVRSGARLQPIGVGSVAMFRHMNRAIEANQLRPVVDEVFPFARANEAIAKLASGTHFGKIVIKVQ